MTTRPYARLTKVGGVGSADFCKAHKPLHEFVLREEMASRSYPEQEEEGEEVDEEVEVEEEEDEKAKTTDLSPEEYSKRQQWEREQEYLKLKLVEDDSEEIRSLEEDTDPFAHLKIVAGVDISFEKENPNHACAMLAILSYPQLKVLHKSQAVVEMNEPYIPGFLAFREVAFLLERLDDVQREHPHLTPQVILVDGNGILHPRGFGLASHLGVLSEIPCVGVGKKLYHVDGLQKDAEHKHKIQTLLNKKGDHFPLTGASGKVWGAAVRTSDQAPNPVYVSLGHKISLETAVQLVVACSSKRVPEPVRQADLLSRAYLRKEKRGRKK